MATATMKRVRRPTRTREFGPESAGTLMSLQEFDKAQFVEGWRYELIHGVLVVSPIPLESECDPNEELGHLLRAYRDAHPQGSTLNATLAERIVKTRRNRRRPDRVIWAGLGRKPLPNENPTVAVEFVSAGKRDRKRDYEEKRDENMEIQIQEYWVIDRFKRRITAFARLG